MHGERRKDCTKRGVLGIQSQVFFGAGSKGRSNSFLWGDRDPTIIPSWMIRVRRCGYFMVMTVTSFIKFLDHDLGFWLGRELRTVVKLVRFPPHHNGHTS